MGSMAAGKLKDIVGEKFQLDVATVTGGEKGLGSTQIEAARSSFPKNSFPLLNISV
jgi:hypothetical protein